jgi:hypothetical protein
MEMSLADPAAGLPPTTAEQLPDDVATLKRMVLELLASLHERNRDNEGLRHRINLLLHRLYGPRGERIDPNQLLLFAETAPAQDSAPAPTEPAAVDKSERRCRPHGRRRLPDNLPREPRHHELSEAERACPSCGRVRVDIGTDRSEQLDYRPASLFVVEHFVHKYVCPCCGRQPVPAQRQQACPAQESEPMPSREAEPQPPSPPGPIAAPARATDGPEAVSPGQQPPGPGESSQAPMSPSQLSNPAAVVIAAPNSTARVP